MQQYFLEKEKFSKQDIFHITKVMRMRTGDKVVVVKDGNKYLATLEIKDGSVNITSEKIFEQNNENKHKLILCVGLLKSDKFDWVVQKASELGVHKIIPMIMKRNVVKISGKEEKKVERWKKIAKEACEQSKRNNITIISKPMNIKDLSSVEANTKIVCYESKEGKHLFDIIASDTIILIGPEGGIDESEIEILKKMDFEIATTSKQILRAETAAICAAAIFNGKEWL